MRTASPLRYPGGKSAMTGLLREIRSLNRLGDRAIAEPFAGGAGASLALLFQEDTRKIFINDADPAIHDFWWTLVNRPRPFLDLLAKSRASLAEWNRQKVVYHLNGRVSRLRRGFSAFYLNRCNRSGIIMNGGPIGGFAQSGEWKIGARFNRAGLIERCEKVAEYRERIEVSSNDGIELLNKLDQKSTFFFIDPPYFEKGQTLYLNALDSSYHKSLSVVLKKMQKSAWVLTYDDCPEIRKMYSGWANIRPFSLRYSAAKKRSGKEIMITPKWMQLPVWQPSLAIQW